MSAEYSAPQKWIDDHSDVYQMLFDDGGVSKPMFDAYLEAKTSREEAAIALSAITRYTLPTPVARGKVNILKTREKSLNYCTDRIMDANWRNEHGTQYNLLKFMEVQEYAALAGATQQVFSAWMRACLVRQVEPPFAALYDDQIIPDLDFSDPGSRHVQIVLTTVASLCNRELYKQRIDFSKLSKRILYFASCGSYQSHSNSAPRVATSLTTELPAKPSPETEYKSTPSALTFPWRGRLKGHSPEELAFRQEAYEPTNLARSLGWPEEKLAAIGYTSYVQKQWIQSRDYTPEDAVARIIFLDEVLLRPPFLAKLLDMPEDRVSAIFTPRAMAMAYRYPWKNPVPKFRRFVDHVQELYEAFPISYTVASDLALIKTSRAAKAKVEMIKTYMAKHPEQTKRLEEFPEHLPELSLEEIISRREAYKPQNLAANLGWSEEKVAQICTPAMREAWVHRRIREPQEVISRLKYLDEELLSPKSLATRLKIPQQQVTSLITPLVLKRYVYETPWASPIPKLRGFLQRFREMSNVYGLDYALARGVAFHVRSARLARERAETIVAQADTCPPKYTRLEWAWATLHYPNPHFIAKRKKYIESHRLDNYTVSTGKIEEVAKYVDIAFVGDVDRERAAAALTSLCMAANINKQEMAAFITFYQDSDKDIPAPPNIELILTRLREAAGKGGYKADF
jgi:hypothetical protein